MKEDRFIRVIAFFVSVLFLFSSAGLSAAAESRKVSSQKQSETPKYGGVLRISDLSDGVSIGYPAKMLRTDANRQGGTAIETLLRYDTKGKLIPWLATSFKEDAKKKNIVLTLRKGVKFHDGTGFNAEAVKWNLEQFIAAKAAGTKRFASIDVVDDYTIRIQLSEWDSTAVNNLASWVGMIISPTAYKKNGPDWAANHPVGTGPFEFVSFERDKRITFKKFNDYWQKGKPYLDGVEWTNIGDPLTREMSLKKGELDVALILDQKGLKKLEDEGYVNTRFRLGSHTLLPDSTNPNSPWSKLKVRQAAQYAINSEELVKVVFAGEAQPANQWAYKGDWAYNPAVVGYPYNPEKAKQLLKEAGYPNGFKTKLMYNKGLYDLGVVAIQGYLQAVGIDVEIDASPQGRFNQAAMDGSWEGLLFGTGAADPDILSVMAVRMSGMANWYKSTDFPQDYVNAIKNAIAAPNFDSKQKRVWEVEKLMVDKYCLCLMLWSVLQPATEQPWVRNSGFFKTTHNGLWTPEDAWLAK